MHRQAGAAGAEREDLEGLVFKGFVGLDDEGLHAKSSPTARWAWSMAMSV